MEKKPVDLYYEVKASSTIRFCDFQPVTKLKAKSTDLQKPRFPIIDAHTHLKNYNSKESVDELLARMDQYGFKRLFDLDGDFGEGFERSMKYLVEPHPDRFTTLCKIDLRTLDDDDFAEKTVAYIENCFARGAKGMKFNSAKPLGLNFRFKDGRPMVYDDERLKPVWEVCAKYDLPAIMHIGDPAAFWDKVDGSNERIEELEPRPSWSYYNTGFPSFEALLEAQERMLSSNPDTKFVIAHVGSHPEDLADVSRMMDAYPNMYVDTSARIAELGRQPYSAREFLIKYQDRVVFGTDGFPGPDSTFEFRFYETFDEYFPYASHLGQGRWYIYGVGLPEDVLKKIYFGNAERLFKL